MTKGSERAGAASLTLAGLCLVAACGSSVAAELQFSPQRVIDLLRGPRAVLAADVDGNGEKDIVGACLACSLFVQEPSLLWYQNDSSSGQPAFTRHNFSHKPAYGENQLAAADMDGDGDVDLLSADFLSFEGGQFSWHENTGGVPPDLVEHPIYLNLGGDADDVLAADLDGDGHLDAAGCSRRDDRIFWFQNDGGKPPAFRTWIIDQDPDGPKGVGNGFADGVYSIAAVDMDGDGDVDLLSASENNNRIAWWENDGRSPPSFTPHEITSRALGARNVASADLDGDGDPDVLALSASDDKIAWYENLRGSPPAFTEHVITMDPDGPAGPAQGLVDLPTSVRIADLDRDGDPDFIVTASNGNRILWFENLGGSPLAFRSHVVTELTLGPNSVDVADLDGDGDLDVLSASFFDNKIAWYENLGPVHHPPIARAGSDVIAECASPRGSQVSLDGSASTDEDSTPGTHDDIAGFEWFERYGAPGETLLGTGEKLTVTLPLGVHALTMRITDRSGLPATDEVVVAIVDTTPPEVTLHAAPGTLWPPNGVLVDVHVQASVTDACGTAELSLLSIAVGPEPEAIEAARKSDLVVVGASLGLPDLDFRLRAERAGNGTGRVYTATYRAVDESGNATLASCQVEVPHDLGSAPR